MSLRKRWSRRRGSMLVDILIGLFVMALGVLTVASTSLASTRSLRRSMDTEFATQAARRQLDLLRDGGFDGLPALSTGQSSRTLSFTPDGGPAGATGQVTLTCVDDSLAATTTETERRRIDVRITWTGTSSGQQSVTLTTLIAK
jgi:Tfp pilus assembly protein PilX